jgi:hypothetical protein
MVRAHERAHHPSSAITRRSIMLTHLPLDDELNQQFYFDGGISRLVWDNALGRCVLQREAAHVDLIEAALMISRGELLWAVPEVRPRLEAGTPVDVVQRESILLTAFLRSPAGRRIPKWSAQRRLELWCRAANEWLAAWQLTRGDSDARRDG